MKEFGIRIMHSVSGNAVNPVHTYRVHMGNIENPNIIHPAIREYVGRKKPEKGHATFFIQKPERTATMEFYPFSEYYTPEFRKKLGQKRIGSLIELLVLKHITHHANGEYRVEHSTRVDSRKIQLSKTGRGKALEKETRAYTINEEIAALEKYLKEKGMLAHVKNSKIETVPHSE